MGKAREGSTVRGDLLLQLLLHLLILLSISKVTTAAALSDYAASFTPQDTHSFWSSEPGGNFTFGFKLVDVDEVYLLAIWHSLDVNQTSIWWADFGDVNKSSNTVKKGATLDYTSSRGVLRLYDSTSSLVWQSSNDTSTSTSLEFLDTGNLRLVKDNNTGNIVWESFEDRRDSLMLNTGLEASSFINKPLVLQSRRNRTSYARGRFHMATYNRFDIHLFGLDGLNKQYVYMKDYNVSLSMSGDVVRIGKLDRSAFVGNNSSLWRLSLDYDANLRVSQWASSKLTWVNVWELMEDSTLTCRAQSPCGAFGLCRKDSENTTRCSCPSGYTSISANDPTKGCNSTRIPPVCGQGKAGNNTVIEEVQQGNYYYNDLTWSSNIYDIEVCKNACLSDCACIAATYDSGSFMCYIKGNSTTGYLENGFISAAGTSTLLMKLLPLQDVGEGQPPPDKKGRHLVPIIVVVVVVVVIVAACIVIWWRRKRTSWSRRCSRKQDNEEWFDAGPRRFSYQELVEATRNFRDLLGVGGFGVVFRGQIRDRIQGEVATTSELGITVVAVKVLKQQGSGTGVVENTAVEQFRAEAGTLGKIHHRNLVSLLGYCIGGPGGDNSRLLVYEYMVNGSLDRYLSPKHMQERLSWSLRYSIAIGTARGITYLHHDCRPRILHCDIKPQNVLLDENFRPKVADFGLASYIEKLDQSHLTVSRAKGTRGYMAPEWHENDGITPKADVYSFGVLLLELIHGFKLVENMSLIVWALQCLAAGSLVPDHEVASAAHAVDQGPHDANVAHEGHTSGSAPPSTQINAEEGESDLEQQLRCLRVALWCVHQVPNERPSMLRALQQLEGTCNIPDLPDPASTSKNECSYSVLSAR